MTLPATPVARVRDVDELLGIIPHLIGFHPEESMVLLLVVGGRVRLTARADLDDLVPSGHLELLVDRVLCRIPDAGVWLVAYSTRPEIAWRLLDRGRQHLGVAMAAEPVCVSGAEYRIGDAHTAPAAHDPAATATAATATLAGLQARPSRRSLADSLRARPEDAADAEAAWRAALERLAAVPEPQRPAAMEQAWQAAAADPDGLDRTACAWLAVLSTVPDARDRATLAIERHTAERCVQVWTRVVQCCPLGAQSQPLALLGLAGWVSGDGALQSICLELLGEQGGVVPLQGLLEQLSAAVVPPSFWDELHPQLLADVNRPAGRRPRSRRRR